MSATDEHLAEEEMRLQRDEARAECERLRGIIQRRVDLNDDDPKSYVVDYEDADMRDAAMIYDVTLDNLERAAAKGE